MADIKESAMSTASDCKWVRALDANGNSIRISKEDLASVVGELVKPLIFNTEIKNNVNVDEIFDTGFYYLYQNITGANNYSFLIVFKHYDGYTTVCTQINVANDNSFIKIRTYKGNLWTAWKNISTTA